MNAVNYLTGLKNETGADQKFNLFKNWNSVQVKDKLAFVYSRKEIPLTKKVFFCVVSVYAEQS